MHEVEPRLRRALVAAYGFEDGRDATAEALGYAWEHWARVGRMPNAAGYLFRVAQSRSRRSRRSPLLFDVPALWDEHRFEAGRWPRRWPPSRGGSGSRWCSSHGFGYTLRRVAELGRS